MNILGPLWIGSPTDIRRGKAAEEALRETSDTKYWDDKSGITKVDHERWKRAQSYEHNTWMEQARNARSDRNDEHYKGFDGYKNLKDDLGEVIEFGCGPFTQLYTILTRADKKAKNITLVDPLILGYVTHPHCTYRHGTLVGYAVIQHVYGAEYFTDQDEFDTAICVNVLEHVQDAEKVLQNLYDCLKVGGTIVFHDRAWDHIDINIVYDVGHPIRLKKIVLDEFLSKFEPIYTKGEYFIGRK